MFKVPDWDPDVPENKYTIKTNKRKKLLNTNGVKQLRKNLKLNNKNPNGNERQTKTIKIAAVQNHKKPVILSATITKEEAPQQQQNEKEKHSRKPIKNDKSNFGKSIANNKQLKQHVKQNKNTEKSLSIPMKNQIKSKKNQRKNDMMEKMIINPLKNELKKNMNKKRIVETKNPESNLNENSKTIIKGSEFRNKLMDSLKGSRFRFLNEQLYTSTGENAIKIFQDDTESFKAYHTGYQQQISQWPMNPLNRIIRSIQKLPKHFIIADFGCGEGNLAKSVTQKVYSMDLVAINNDIIACDMAHTPLQSDSIDVAVFCLSLMGTNLQDFILESNRVLKIGGLLKIAEVESRFTDDCRDFIKNVQQFGYKLLNKDLTNNLFYFLNFKKINTISNLHKNNNNSIKFNLKPCLYKKR